MSRRVFARLVAVVLVAAALALSPQPVPTASAASWFTDDFSSGGFGAWGGVTNLSIDTGMGKAAPPSARAQPVSVPAYAYKVLPSTLSTVCMSMNVSVASLGSGPVLLRLRTAADGPVARVFVTSGGLLSLRADASGAQLVSGVALGSGWHGVELCGTVGTAGAWDLYRDGVKVVSGWVANTGTTPVGRVQIGDNAAKTFTMNIDDVAVTDTHAAVDVDPPTTPGKPTGSSTSPGTISIRWAASQDASPPITYRVYRDGGSGMIGSTTSLSFTDVGLATGTSHTYRVDAVDARSNPPSAKSPASDPIVVSAVQALFTDDFSSGGFGAWGGVTNLSIDTGMGKAAPPSARAQPVSVPAYAYKVLPSTLSTVCMSMNVSVASLGSGPVLLRLRTAADGPVARVFVTSGGLLSLRADASGAQLVSGVALGSGWHGVELCGTVGTAGAWDLYRDGVKVVSGWVANTGTTPVGRVQIGDNAAKTFTMNIDDVAVRGPAAPPSQSPNVLIILTDDQRATDTVLPGVMPKLRQWLKDGGREYTNFFGTTPLCCPDRSVILSGRYAHNTGVRTNVDTVNLDQRLTMERLLDANGYETAYVGKFLNDWNVNTAPPYFDHRSLVGGGYVNQYWNIDGVGKTYPDYTTDFIGQRAVSYLDHFEASDTQPWMMMLGTPAPHNPWTPAAKYASAAVGTWAGNPATAETDRSDKPPWVRAKNFSLAQAEVVRVPQLRTLMSVDDMVGTVMTRLQTLGELSNTLVVYTSDNGYVWGEHRLGGDYGLAAQKRYPYTESVQLPLYVRWDGKVSAGSTDARLSGTVDLAATVLKAAGIAPDYALDGRSIISGAIRDRILLEYWLDPGDSSIPTWVSTRTNALQFVEYYDAGGAVTFREYYDLSTDRWQLVNLLNDGNPVNPDVSQLVTRVRSDATCSGTTETVPVPANPCP